MGNFHEESRRVPGRGAYTNSELRIEEIAREGLLAATRSSTEGNVEATEKVSQGPVGSFALRAALRCCSSWFLRF